MRRLTTIGAGWLILVHLTVAYGQATLTGKWQGETNNGREMVLDLTAKGDTLTGTLTRAGESTPISDGKVSKTSFTFKAKINGQVENVSGEHAGDQIKIWLDRQGASDAIVLKRVKAK